MMTIDDLREAWTYALLEIDAAINFLEAEGASAVADNDPNRAAGMWLTNLRRNRIEYDVLLTQHRSVH